jgi:transposase-like protein
MTLKHDIIDGIVEVDECFIRESYKGNHSKSTIFTLPRESRKRGKSKFEKKPRGISNDQICVETAIDRKGNILMGAVCNGRITTKDIVSFFDGKIGKDVTFCTDEHKSYPAIEKVLDVNLKQVPSGKQMIDNVFHIQHINSLHSAFKRWIIPFNGVATKYLNNYLAWFKFLQISKKNKKSDRIKDLLVNVATKDTCITKETIKHRYIELV